MRDGRHDFIAGFGYRSWVVTGTSCLLMVLHGFTFQLGRQVDYAFNALVPRQTEDLDPRQAVEKYRLLRLWGILKVVVNDVVNLSCRNCVEACWPITQVVGFVFKPEAVMHTWIKARLFTYNKALISCNLELPPFWTPQAKFKALFDLFAFQCSNCCQMLEATWYLYRDATCRTWTNFPSFFWLQMLQDALFVMRTYRYIHDYASAESCIKSWSCALWKKGPRSKIRGPSYPRTPIIQRRTSWHFAAILINSADTTTPSNISNPLHHPQTGCAFSWGGCAFEHILRVTDVDLLRQVTCFPQPADANII